MADAGFTHAAGADIPHSATSRRGMLPALAGLAVGLAYATISVYWAVGGRWLLNTVGISPSQPGQAGHLAALLAVWGAAAVKAVATVLPLLAIGVWPRTANGGLRRLARVLTWIEAAILVGYGLVLTASGLLVQAGAIKAAAHADRLAREWHAYLWDPWFLIWGIFVFLALWRSRSASQDHLPGAPGAAAARSYGYPGAAGGRGGGGGCPWPGGGGHRPGGGQFDAGEPVPPAADRHHAMAGSLTGRAQRGQRAGDNDGELRGTGRPVAVAALLAAGPTWLAVGVASGFLAAATLLLWPVRLYQQHPDPGHARGSLPGGHRPGTGRDGAGGPARGDSGAASATSPSSSPTPSAHSSPPRSSSSKEHGSVAWSGSARSELADLGLLSALTPDAERREYSI
jgi:hypothetical protein